MNTWWLGWWVDGRYPSSCGREITADNELRVRLCVKRRLFRLRTQLSLFWKETAQMLCIKRKQGWGINYCSLFDGWRWEVWRETVENSNII